VTTGEGRTAANPCPRGPLCPSAPLPLRPSAPLPLRPSAARLDFTLPPRYIDCRLMEETCTR